MKLKNSEVGKFVPIRVPQGIYYGGFQNSLGDMGVSKFYRDRSCVVTAFTNTYLYLYHKDKTFSLEEYNTYHYEFFKQLRPHANGVPTALALDRRSKRIISDRNLDVKSHLIEDFLFKKKSKEKKIDFINEALSRDLPVIFINWVSNNVKVMRHHGVTITECNNMGDYHELVISSWGNLYRVNFEVFEKQFRTYSGLIYFERKDHGISEM